MLPLIRITMTDKMKEWGNREGSSSTYKYILSLKQE